MAKNRFANRVISYFLGDENYKLPKETMVAFEQICFKISYVTLILVFRE